MSLTNSQLFRGFGGDRQWDENFCLTQSDSVTPYFQVALSNGAVTINSTLFVSGAITAAGGITGSGPSSQTDESASRALMTVYRNTSGKPMYVSASFGPISSTTMIAYSDSSSTPSTVVAETGCVSSSHLSLFFIVLNNNYYSVSNSGGTPAIVCWMEYT